MPGQIFRVDRSEIPDAAPAPLGRVRVDQLEPESGGRQAHPVALPRHWGQVGDADHGLIEAVA